VQYGFEGAVAGIQRDRVRRLGSACSSGQRRESDEVRGCALADGIDSQSP